MNFGRTDITILVASTLGILLMSFAFPALGLTGDAAAENEVPEFSISADRFDIAGEFPERPGSPAGGPLLWSNDGRFHNQVWLQGGTSSGYQLFLVNNGNLSDPEAEFQLDHWDSASVVASDSTNISNEGGFAELTADEYTVFVEVNEFENVNESDLTIRGEYTVRDQPSNDDWYDRVPLVGGAISAATNVAGMVGWVGAILLWTGVTFFEMILNFLGVVVDVLLFMFGLASFLTATYSDVVSGAPAAWAQVILLVPLVMLFVEWAKLGALFVEIVWIG